MWDLLQAVLLGSGTGLLGSLLTEAMSIWRYKQETAARAMTYQHEKDLIKLQQQGEQAEWEHEVEIASMAADESVRVASYKHDASVGETSQWVNNVLRMVRPTLTLVLIMLTAYVAWSADDSTRLNITNQIVAMTSMAISWWFGDRGKRSNKISS